MASGDRAESRLAGPTQLGTSTTTTTFYTVRLAAGDYFEVPSNYTGLIGGIFATAGTARVTLVT